MLTLVLCVSSGESLTLTLRYPLDFLETPKKLVQTGTSKVSMSEVEEEVSQTYRRLCSHYARLALVNILPAYAIARPAFSLSTVLDPLTASSCLW